jgi:phosphoribosylformylglycinamidine synthase
MILRAAGTNCDLETQHAWERAGATADRIHVRRWIETPSLLDNYQILTIPGGFSYGDDIAAGLVLAAQLARHLVEQIAGFVDRGGLVIGICNGFQVLVAAGLLPQRAVNGARSCTITTNSPPGFQDRWVHLRAGDRSCAFLEPGRTYSLPIAHGEGRVVFASEDDYQAAVQGRHDVLTYDEPPDDLGATPGAPANPNGSTGSIAGLCDDSGRVFGLMPHPERFVDRTQHPAWTSRSRHGEGDGLAMFAAAIRALG